MGDPSGIGPEIIVKAAIALARNGAARIVVVGDLAAMRECAQRISGAPKISEWRAGERLPKGLGVLATGKLDAGARVPGRPTVAGGEASYHYVVAGARMALAGEVDALVTAPISKEWWNRAGHRYPGHSELLARFSHTRLWRMMFVGERLNVALVTVHMGLAKVSKALTRARVLDTIRLLARHMREDRGIANPRLGVLGFNPHAGEGGLFGDEEIRVIEPALRRARAEGIDAFGPLAPDTAFIRVDGRFGFDAAVAMYHDQGLIAVKTLEFDRAVNVTLGIPFIRTSPDHGTAFAIAGQGKADPSSMLAAIEYAAHAAAVRRAAGRSAA